MPLVVADRVRETTTTAGTGTITLAGAVTGFQTFAVIGNGNTTYYTIAGQGTSEWEVGIGILKELQFLDLRGNRLEKFPEQLDKLEHLEELYLSENMLKDIPSDIGGMEKLKKLHIHCNSISLLANDLYYMPHLQVQL